MIPTSSLGSTPVDPTTLRAIEQISHVINDIEQRLQIVRVALAQSVPASGFSQPNTPVNPFAAFGQLGQLGQAGSPFGQTSPAFGQTNPFVGAGLQNPWALLQSLASNPVVLQQLMALSQQMGSLYGVPSGVPATPFGIPTGFGNPGVIAPFGANPGFLAQTTPFRF